MTQQAAGWFPDPQLPGQLRYWDGAAWTAHTQPGAPTIAPNANGAVPSLVLGIVSLVLCGLFTGIPAMVVGRRAIKDVDRSNGRLGGRGMAQAGFWTGLAGTTFSAIGVLIFLAVVTTAGTTTSEFDDNCRVINSDGTSSPC